MKEVVSIWLTPLITVGLLESVSHIIDLFSKEVEKVD